MTSFFARHGEYSQPQQVPISDPKGATCNGSGMSLPLPHKSDLLRVMGTPLNPPPAHGLAKWSTKKSPRPSSPTHCQLKKGTQAFSADFAPLSIHFQSRLTNLGFFSANISSSLEIQKLLRIFSPEPYCLLRVPNSLFRDPKVVTSWKTAHATRKPVTILRQI